MNTQFALAYIPRRMQELGYGDSYMIRFRHLRIRANTLKRIKAKSTIYLLVDADEFNGLSSTTSGGRFTDITVPASSPIMFTITSPTGIFHLTNPALGEMQYEHSGNIEIRNISTTTDTFIKLIQIIPLNK